jgi:hypothetical protein
MKNSSVLKQVWVTGSLALLAAGAIAAQDRYTVKVPNGLGFAEFRGYDSWQFVSMSQNGPMMAIILGNPTLIAAFKSGIPENGKPFPDGAKMAKIHWIPKKNEAAPGQPLVPSVLHDVDFMVKDSKRFADSGGWGYGAFEYDDATGSFSPGTEANSPPQGHDAKCGAACHTAAQKSDYVFTRYPKR